MNIVGWGGGGDNRYFKWIRFQNFKTKLSSLLRFIMTFDYLMVNTRPVKRILKCFGFKTIGSPPPICFAPPVTSTAFYFVFRFVFSLLFIHYNGQILTICYLPRIGVKRIRLRLIPTTSEFI